MPRRLALLAALSVVGCGSPPQAPAPQTMSDVVTQFLSAVKDNDLNRMSRFWGTERGPAGTWMKPEELKKRLTVIQRYLAHDGYRVVEGPLVVPGKDNMRTYRVELQRKECSVVVPIDLARARDGGWLVRDVHLEALGNPAAPCRPRPPGTGA